MVTELSYTTTHTYLIDGAKGTILFDTGWAGTFSAFCREMGEKGRNVQEIDYILVSHFHPDHMGIAEEIADLGPRIVAVDLQVPFLHSSDAILGRDGNTGFRPILDEKVRVISLSESRDFLASLGLAGEILHTPGHSDDSISLWLDDGDLFVGDLNPLYELELHAGTEIEESWNRLLARKPKRVFYGHAKTAVLRDEDRQKGQEEDGGSAGDDGGDRKDLYLLVSRIMRYIDKGCSMERIRKKTGADPVFIEDVNRMYLTHRNVGVQGILDRIEIKGR